MVHPKVSTPKALRLAVLAVAAAVAAGGALAESRPAAPAAAPATQPAAGNGAIHNPDMEKAGQLAAHAWLLLLDRGDWGTAWDTASNVFRQKVPLDTWMDAIPKVRAPYGRFIERQPAEVMYKKTLAGRPEGDYVTALFVSKFEKKPDVQEIVTVERESDGRWHVTGYQTK
jgi:hypothetical protein